MFIQHPRDLGARRGRTPKPAAAIARCACPFYSLLARWSVLPSNRAGLRNALPITSAAGVRVYSMTSLAHVTRCRERRCLSTGSKLATDLLRRDTQLLPLDAARLDRVANLPLALAERRRACLDLDERGWSSSVLLGRGDAYRQQLLALVRHANRVEAGRAEMGRFRQRPERCADVFLVGDSLTDRYKGQEAHLPSFGGGRIGFMVSVEKIMGKTPMLDGRRISLVVGRRLSVQEQKAPTQSVSVRHRHARRTGRYPPPSTIDWGQGVPKTGRVPHGRRSALGRADSIQHEDRGAGTKRDLHPKDRLARERSSPDSCPGRTRCGTTSSSPAQYSPSGRIEDAAETTVSVISERPRVSSPTSARSS